MRKILISIKPKWTAKILNGEKTIEVRRTAPKCELPCEVYIYCTKDKNELRLFDKEICEQFKGSDRARAYSTLQQKYYTALIGRKSVPCNGKVVARFTLNKVEKIEYHRHRTLDDFDGYYIDHGEKMNTSEIEIGEMACLGHTELDDYLKEQNGYAWEISDLVIFDEPKELKEFGVKRPPQAWCYCEVDE